MHKYAVHLFGTSQEVREQLAVGVHELLQKCPNVLDDLGLWSVW